MKYSNENVDFLFSAICCNNDASLRWRDLKSNAAWLQSLLVYQRRTLEVVLFPYAHLQSLLCHACVISGRCFIHVAVKVVDLTSLSTNMIACTSRGSSWGICDECRSQQTLLTSNASSRKRVCSLVPPCSALSLPHLRATLRNFQSSSSRESRRRWRMTHIRWYICFKRTVNLQFFRDIPVLRMLRQTGHVKYWRALDVDAGTSVPVSLQLGLPIIADKCDIHQTSLQAQRVTVRNSNGLNEISHSSFALTMLRTALKQSTRWIGLQRLWLTRIRRQTWLSFFFLEASFYFQRQSLLPFWQTTRSIKSILWTRFFAKEAEELNINKECRQGKFCVSSSFKNIIILYFFIALYLWMFDIKVYMPSRDVSQWCRMPDKPFMQDSPTTEHTPVHFIYNILSVNICKTFLIQSLPQATSIIVS